MNIENLALGYVKTAPSPATTGTSLTLETNEGARFPETTDSSFYATLMPADANPHSDNSEVVEVTDRTGDVLTIVREQRGTTAQSVGVGWIVLNSVYKEDLDDLKGSNSFIFSETPTGDIDGLNDTFTLANTPTTNTLQLFRDGQLLKGGGVDYTLTDDEIVFTTAPEVDSILLAHYHKVAVGSGNANTLDGQHAPTGDIVGTTDTQTLTNKTLTSPVITSPTYQGLIDGWVSANETWTYASATSITVPSGATAKYQKGDKIKITNNSATKYFYIIGVADTVLTVTGGSDYTVHDSTITANYYSKVENPQGFPGRFNYTPVLTASTDTVPVFSTISARFTISQNLINIIFSMSGDGGTDGSGTNPLEISTPVSIFAGGNGVFTWASASTSGVGVFLYSLSGKTQFRRTPTTEVTPNDFPNGARYIMGHIVGNF